jgi:5,10-methylenetetrahydromethanopterin reductase
MQRLAGRAADGLLTPSITTPDFVRYSWENVRAGAEAAGRDPESIDVGCTLVASIGDDAEAGRDGAREITAMYLANKVQNIQGAAQVLLEKANLDVDEIRPVAEAMEQGGRLAAKAAVTDAILDKCKPIAGTPSQCIDRILEYRDAGCTHIMLELWGSERERQLELFGTKVLPAVRA